MYQHCEDMLTKLQFYGVISRWECQEFKLIAGSYSGSENFSGHLNGAERKAKMHETVKKRRPFTTVNGLNYIELE